jgi:hypothetical protein
MVIVVRRIAPVLISVVLTLSTLACIGVCDMFAPSPWEITHGYYLLNDEFGVSIHTRSGRSTYPYVVRSDVIDLDWNSEFIVVKQNPREELGEPDTGVANWYIIDVVNQVTFGPYTYAEYIRERARLSVSDSLELLEPGQELWEGYRRKHRQED